MKNYMYTDKPYFVKTKEYKIIDDGIWIPKEELEELMKYYDSECTKLYERVEEDPSYASREYMKADIHYKICRDLVKLISQKKQ